MRRGQGSPVRGACWNCVLHMPFTFAAICPRNTRFHMEVRCSQAKARTAPAVVASGYMCTMWSRHSRMNECRHDNYSWKWYMQLCGQALHRPAPQGSHFVQSKEQHPAPHAYVAISPPDQLAFGRTSNNQPSINSSQQRLSASQNNTIGVGMYVWRSYGMGDTQTQ